MTYITLYMRSSKKS